MYVVGFNGPPECGKDTAAELLRAEITRAGVPHALVHLESLSYPLRSIAYAITGWTGPLDGENYEKFKRTRFQIGQGDDGETGRQIMIDSSERFLKPVYGEEVMADMLLSRISLKPACVILVRDCGFQSEVNPIINAVGSKNFYLVNVWRDGKTFEGDSREWVTHAHSMQLDNNGTLPELATECQRIYGRLVNQMGWVL